MAGLVESGLRNLNYGDADSVGFFQMRVGIWNQGDYAGYPDNAELQLKWFLDQAEAVKQQRVAAGKSVDDPNSYGEWVADVERPRAQYRGRYQLRLEEARGLLGRLRAAAQDARGRRRPRAGRRGERRAVRARARRRPWPRPRSTWGPRTSGAGLRRRPASTARDSCSGPTPRRASRCRAPPSSRSSPPNGRSVDRDHLRPGDLVFFRNSGGDVHHVGISLGGDRFINAPHTGATCAIDEPEGVVLRAGVRRRAAVRQA